MSYRFNPNSIYRMPTHFGPAPGPRQGPDGGTYPNTDSPHVITAWVTIRTSGERLAAHLPPGFEPAADPLLYMEVRNLRDLSWLAGRGYNILHVSFAAVSPTTGREGRMTAAVWESLPDAVTTGREEISVPKLFADVDELAWPSADHRHCLARARWNGFCFFEMAVDKLEDVGTNDPRPAIPYFHWRYMPRAGALCEAEISHSVVAPVDLGRQRIVRVRTGEGSIKFSSARFEDLPTFFHVVNGLAAFENFEVTQAGVIETVGRSDHRQQEVQS